MEFIDFNEIAEYFQRKIDMIVYNLQESGQIARDIVDRNGKVVDQAFKFVFFVNKGEYHKAVQEANATVDRRYPEIPVLIKNAGGIQDASASIEIYLQKVEFEVYGCCDLADPLKNQWHDVELIFSYLCTEMKGITDSLLGNTIKVETSDFPVITELENKHFLCMLASNVHIMFNAHLSNLDIIKVNGVRIPYINFTESFQTELIANNRKTLEVKFQPNVSTYQLQISGLYVKDNSVVNLLIEGATTGDLYGQPFGVEVIRDGVVLANRTMYVRELTTVRNFGSIVAYKLVLYPAFGG